MKKLKKFVVLSCVGNIQPGEGCIRYSLVWATSFEVAKKMAAQAEPNQALDWILSIQQWKQIRDQLKAGGHSVLKQRQKKETPKPKPGPKPKSERESRPNAEYRPKPK